MKKDKTGLEVENREEDKKKRTVLLVLCILTILVALVGSSFAFFAANILGDKQESISVTTTTLEGVTYQSSKTIVLNDAVPGDHDETNFTISNPNKTARVKYSLKFIADKNDFSKEEGLGQLLITVTGRKINDKVVIDFTDSTTVKDGIIATDIYLNPEESDDYTLRLDFIDTGVVQDSNMKKTFVGHVEISQTIAVQ